MLVIDLTTLLFRPTILIDEVGNDHDGDLTRAYALTRLAAENGADIVKFQKYRPVRSIAHQPRRSVVWRVRIESRL